MDASDIRPPPWMSGKQHAICHSTWRFAMADGHPNRWSTALTNGWDADGRSVQPTATSTARWSGHPHPNCRLERLTARWTGCPRRVVVVDIHLDMQTYLVPSVHGRDVQHMSEHLPSLFVGKSCHCRDVLWGDLLRYSSFQRCQPCGLPFYLGIHPGL